MDKLLTFGRKVLQSQPFSALLGAELSYFEPGHAVLSLIIREELKQQHGFVHGGVISYLADNALTFAGGSVLGDAVTAEYKVNYLRPAIGETLEARASVIYGGRRQAVCQCHVFVIEEGKEKLVAIAQGTITKVNA